MSDVAHVAHRSKTSHEAATKKIFDQSVTSATDPIREVVNDLLEQLSGHAAMMWQDDPVAIREFVAHGGVEMMTAAGWVVTQHGIDPWTKKMIMYAEVPVVGGITPHDVFLMEYEVTGNRDDVIPCWELRGHYLAEYCTLKVSMRNDGIRALIGLGAKRGRTKELGSVLRGVRRWEPMTVEEIAAAFDAEVIS